jgi:SAM-dependent methyltransferase
MPTTIAPPPRSKLFRTGHAYADIAAMLADVEPKGRCLDLPAGKGVNLHGIRAAGFEPLAADICPPPDCEDKTPYLKVDFTEPLPFGDDSFEAVLCSEGIEHCAKQHQLVREFARVVKPGGHLLITTPNILNLRARWAYLFTGWPTLTRRPISEQTSTRGGTVDKPLFGHVFLISYPVLRALLRRAGFDHIRVATAKYSLSSLLLAPLLWLPVRFAMWRRMRMLRELDLHATADEMTKHIMSPDMLFGKKLILLARRGPDYQA